jgi:hypothetical protein
MLFVLIKKCDIDSSCGQERVVAIADSEKELRHKWNAFVAQSYSPERLPTFNREAVKCTMTYTGGGCYAVHTYTIVLWKDEI